jgi:hypothetical protein
VELYRSAIEATRDPAESAMLMSRLAEVRRGQGLYAESVRLYRRAIPMLEAAPVSEAELRDVRGRYDAVLRESARTMVFAK